MEKQNNFNIPRPESDRILSKLERHRVNCQNQIESGGENASDQKTFERRIRLAILNEIIEVGELYTEELLHDLRQEYGEKVKASEYLGQVKMVKRYIDKKTQEELRNLEGISSIYESDF